MQWTKERPKQAGVYWVLIRGVLGVVTIELDGACLYGIAVGVRGSLASMIWDASSWQGPIEAPEPPIATTENN
jgi:hypothetical protein